MIKQIHYLWWQRPQVEPRTRPRYVLFEPIRPALPIIRSVKHGSFTWAFTIHCRQTMPHEMVYLVQACESMSEFVVQTLSEVDISRWREWMSTSDARTLWVNVVAIPLQAWLHLGLHAVTDPLGTELQVHAWVPVASIAHTTPSPYHKHGTLVLNESFHT